jgi:dihydroorotate dehydrogenase (fumarate)
MRLTTSFVGLTLQSPVIIASGPATHDVNQVQLAEEQHAGAVVLKTACSDKFASMRSWPRPRYKLLDWDKQIAGRSKAFSLYSYEQGYSGSLSDYWRFIEVCKKHAKIPVIGSIFADDPRDWESMAREVQQSGADAIELDISSPHRPGSLGFETSFVAAIKTVVGAMKIPVLVKLAPGSDVVQQSVTAQECGAAAVSLCNRLRGVDVDVESQRPILHGYYGGIGGPWAKYYNFRHVAEASQAISIPISGTGGTMSGEDVIKYILLGATTVQVLSVIMVNGWKSVGKMNAEIEEYMNRKGITSLSEIRGKAVESITRPENIIRWSGESKKGPRNVWGDAGESGKHR